MKRVVFALGLGAGCCRLPPPPPTTVPAQDVTTDCIADCLRDNMARAVAPEVIENDCKQACSPADKLSLEPR